MCVGEDVEWQMLCYRRTLDGACINIGTFHEISPMGRHSCTPSSHPLCFLILSCSLCCQDSEFCFHFLISYTPLALMAGPRAAFCNTELMHWASTNSVQVFYPVSWSEKMQRDPCLAHQPPSTWLQTAQTAYLESAPSHWNNQAPHRTWEHFSCVFRDSLKGILHSFFALMCKYIHYTVNIIDLIKGF